MIDFSELSRAWQALYRLAPQAFMPITNDGELDLVTRFLKALDEEMGEAPDHPLRGLADSLMLRITAYEAERFPIPDVDGADMLAFYLDQREMTQQQLAEASGVRQSTISQLLNRKRAFTADHARAMGRVFGVEPGMFL